MARIYRGEFQGLVNRGVPGAPTLLAVFFDALEQKYHEKTQQGVAALQISLMEPEICPRELGKAKAAFENPLEHLIEII